MALVVQTNSTCRDITPESLLGIPYRTNNAPVALRTGKVVASLDMCLLLRLDYWSRY